jgi:poly(hydroxyalkanoate) depolymerase family esterase
LNTNSIKDTIDKALTAAGLTRGLPNADRLRARIDQALAASGLSTRRPFTPAPAPTDVDAEQGVLDRVDSPVRGRFLSLSHQGPMGVRGYKLYIPAAYKGVAMPLVVMLHGCKQNPDDFAAGTQMNRLAEERGFLVAYPAQSAKANGSNCWNWFEPAQQSREGAEPSILVGIVNEIAAAYAVHADQVFVAGLSAGAAMAVILGRTHPEVFAGVAAHSGLPAGAAHDMASAFAAMRGLPRSPAADGTSASAAYAPTPRTIVLHGSADTTVKASNGDAIVAQAVAAFEAGVGPLRHVTYNDRGRNSAAGHAARVAVWSDEIGVPQVEHWLVQGGAHAWFGGHASGSYTDAAGPDASAEIVRFFMHR